MCHMLQRTSKSLAWTLTLAAMCGLSAVASGQQVQQPVTQDQNYAAGSSPIANVAPFQTQSPTPQVQPTSYAGDSTAAPIPPQPPPPSAETSNDELAQRVADLEKRLADLAAKGGRPRLPCPRRRQASR